jgi:hypothetical protein
MRRVLSVLAVLVTVGMLAPPVFAQAPAAAPTPQVTINGFIQQVTSWTHNLSLTDLTTTRSGDKEWYARTRLRLDPSATIGNVKAVARLEFDQVWGDTGCPVAGAAGSCSTVALPKGAGQHAGTNAGSPLNTDVLGAVEVTWLYTEFPLTGEGSLLPFIPVASVARAGLQPFDITYKLGVYETGDFSGVHVVTNLSPNIQLRNTFTMVEEASTGVRDGFVRGDDFAGTVAVDITPFEGLNLRPFVSKFFADGATSGSSRVARGGITLATAFPNAGVTQPTPGVGVPARNNTPNENRYTVGLDSRWRSGAFSIEPTIIYQFGSRQAVVPDVLSAVSQGLPANSVGAMKTADISAWFIDVIGGYRLGPLLVELRGMYTTGNKDKTNLFEHVNFFQPVDTDTTYWATWNEIMALDVDFVQLGIPSGNGGPGNSIGYDRYGRLSVGWRAFYDITPNFTPWLKGSANWTAESVQENSLLSAAAGLTPLSRVDGSKSEKSNYLATEVDLGFTWRFAPGIFFETVYGHLFHGDALNQKVQLNDPKPRDAQDVDTWIARINYSW